MHLTGQELTAASGAVAALAIVGGYLGVRSANRNALKIAREERTTRRKDELDALKRATYARLLAALAGLSLAATAKDAASHNAKSSSEHWLSVLRLLITALQIAQDTIAEVNLIAPDIVCELADKAFVAASTCTTTDGSAYYRTFGGLSLAMRNDLRGSAMPSLEEIESIGTVSVPAKPDGAAG
jgi:hypothetical protein